MKKIFISIFEYAHVLLYFSPAIAFAVMIFAFKHPAADHSAAQAEQREGIYIFLLSKPVAAYEYQGSVKVGLRISGDPLATLIKQCKKEYPAADGLIISDPDLQKAKADCIKFKE